MNLSLILPAPFIFPFILTDLLVPVAETRATNDATGLHCEGANSFNTTLRIKAKPFNLGFIRAEDLVSQLDTLGAFFCCFSFLNSGQLSRVSPGLLNLVAISDIGFPKADGGHCAPEHFSLQQNSFLLKSRQYIGW